MATEVETRDPAGLAKNLKRSNKPLMERRRRCRINASLNQLKSLVLDALNKDTSQYSKLEKADILEMTVRHLRNLQRQQINAAAASDSSVVGKFQAGFSECAGEVSRYLSTVDGISPDIRCRLLDHLGQSVGRVLSSQNPQEVSTNQQLHVQIPYATQASSLPGATAYLATNVAANSHVVQGPRGAQYIGAFHVVPTSAFQQQGISAQGIHTAYVMAGNPPTQIRLVSSPYGSSGSTASSPSPQSSVGSRTPSPFSHESRDSPVNLVKPQVLVAHPMASRGISQEKVWRPW